MAEPACEFAVGIMARAPVPGRAKTRLIPLLGSAGAAALQAQLIERSLRLATAAAPGRVYLFTTGDGDWQPWRSRFAPTCREQRGADLGERMLAALRQMLAQHERALLIGTDCPALQPGHLYAAAGALATARMSFVPAEDGGYVLVGGREASARAFADIAWGTDAVMQTTRARLLDLGWRAGRDWVELPPLWDVDRPGDYRRARAEGLLRR